MIIMNKNKKKNKINFLVFNDFIKLVKIKFTNHESK